VSSQTRPAPPSRWRRWVRTLHRDIGYCCAALTIVYAVSGIAVNHTHHWNPNYDLNREHLSFPPVPVGEKAPMVERLVEVLDLPGPPKSSFRPSPAVVELYYEGWHVRADAEAGTAMIERPSERFLLRDANFLHLNHPKGVWTYVADLYALALGFLGISGLFILRGRQGLGGRGKWFLLAGLIVPLVFVALRYLA
jgi:hypothetical protein